MFRNNILSFGFFILKISFTYRITILETPKTVKGNLNILEECSGARRKV